MTIMIPEYSLQESNLTSDKDSDEISFTRTRLYTPTSSIYSTDSECEALNHPQDSDYQHESTEEDQPEYNDDENAIARVYHDNDNRQVTIHHTTDSIHGTYTFFDTLSLSTTTGSIDVTINQEPIPSPSSSPLTQDQPSRVIISSDTGDIRVSFQESQQHVAIPRVYTVDIRTGTGNIEGTIPFTDNIALQTTSGCIRAVLVPVISGVVPWAPSILTVSGTGSQFVCVAEPVMLSGLGLRPGLGERVYPGQKGTMGQASHVSSEGSLNIRYPTAWAGWVELRGCSNCMVGEGVVRVCSGDGCVRGVKQQHGQGTWRGSNDMGISLRTRGSAMFTITPSTQGTTQQS